jgi:Uma2 family endonuclease
MCAIEYYTYDDYKHWEGDWELINGIAYAMSPSPVKKHQKLSGYIFRDLLSQIDECDRCEVVYEFDYKVSEDTILRPDIALICDEENEAYMIKAPEIVVEVISKATAKRDEVYKFDIYQKEKVKYYILVYPDDLRAKVYKLKDDSFQKEGDFTFESYKFENTTCKVELDFEKVFKKLKK